MVPRTVLQYQLTEKIGGGGMGEIYKARDTRLNRFVAMKVLPPALSADPERRRRFVQEAQAVSALNHPNIITIYDIVDDNETQYMVVEYVDGKTLLELIPQGGLRVPQVIGYATQIAEALAVAHAAGIIHRDLKPANIMVTSAGLVKVLDFGLAKLVDWGPGDPSGSTVTIVQTPLTIEGTLMGTVNYMSPEQAEGRRVDARSDIFSFGAVLYEMLTGQFAFRGNSVISTLSAVLRDDIQPVRELTPEVPSELERILEGCLKKDPEQRFQSMQEVQTALAALKRQSESGALYNPGIASAILPPAMAARRGSKAPAIGAVVVLGLVAAGGGYWWMTHRGSLPGAGGIPPVSTSAAPPEPVTPAAVTPLSPAGAGNQEETAKSSPLMPDASTPASRSAASVVLPDGLPIQLILADDVPSDAAPGLSMTFRVAEDVRVNDAVVIRKNAPAIGSVVDSAKKKIILGGKVNFRLERVDAVDGQKVPIRATVTHSRDGLSKRAVDGSHRKSKDIATAAGTEYRAYVEGPKTVFVKK